MPFETITRSLRLYRDPRGHRAEHEHEAHPPTHNRRARRCIERVGRLSSTLRSRVLGVGDWLLGWRAGFRAYAEGSAMPSTAPLCARTTATAAAAPPAAPASAPSPPGLVGGTTRCSSPAARSSPMVGSTAV